MCQVAGISTTNSLAEIGSLFCFNCGVKYLLYVIHVFTKSAWVEPWTDKNAKRKPNKFWIDQRRKFDNNLMQNSLDNKDVLMYLIYNEGKSVFSETFIRTLKGKTYKK